MEERDTVIESYLGEYQKLLAGNSRASRTYVYLHTSVAGAQANRHSPTSSNTADRTIDIYL